MSNSLRNEATTSDFTTVRRRREPRHWIPFLLALAVVPFSFVSLTLFGQMNQAEFGLMLIPAGWLAAVCFELYARSWPNREEHMGWHIGTGLVLALEGSVIAFVWYALAHFTLF